MKILIAGAGYVGGRLAEMLALQEDTAHCLSRSAADVPAGAHAIRCDLTDRNALARAVPSGLDHVVYCAAPSSGDEAGYRLVYERGLGNLLDVLEARPERPRVFFTSSTAVYAQVDGSVVDETSPTLPEDYSGQIQLIAEARLHASSLPGTVVRLGGIYGPGRTRLIDAVRAGSATYSRVVDEHTNRIHRDDVAGALMWLMQRSDRGEPVDRSYVFVDHDPALRREVLGWLASRMGAPAPQGVDTFDTGRRGSRSNKRCSNQRLALAGYRFRYPSFRDGYAEMLAAVST